MTEPGIRKLALRARMAGRWQAGLRPKRKFLYNRGICIYHIRINESILHDRPIPFVIEGEIGAQIDKETVVGAKRTESD